MIYFVTAGRADELYVIRKLHPAGLLLSYWYFRNRNLTEWIKELGYYPAILFDSGAWSAHNAGAEISIHQYAEYIQTHRHVISEYINLDVIGDAKATIQNQRTLEQMGLKPMPVFHYGTEEKELEALSFRYKRVALGGTVPIKDKKQVATWVQNVAGRYSSISFHVLGTSSKQVRSRAPANCTFDASTWVLMAANGKPRSIPGKTVEAKRERMEYWMKHLSREVEREEDRQLTLF